MLAGLKQLAVLQQAQNRSRKMHNYKNLPLPQNEQLLQTNPINLKNENKKWTQFLKKLTEIKRRQMSLQIMQSAVVPKQHHF